MDLWLWIFGGILSVLALIGNDVVIVLITMRRRLRTTANCFVFSLAVADFLFGALYLPLCKLREVYSESHESYSRICLHVVLILSAASVTNLCVMTLDRYISIVHPLRYVTFMRPRRVRILISVAWTVAMIRPSFHLNNVFAIPNGVGDALGRLDNVLYWIIPCIALLLATVHILLIVRRHSKQRAASKVQLRYNYSLGCHPERSVSSQTREAVSAKVMLAVVLVFVLCFGMKVYIRFSKQNGDAPLFKLFRLLVVINSAANPFAYAFFKTDIKRQLQLFYSCLMANH